jgi:hypothetical protein
MRLSDNDRKSIERRVGGTASDGALAVNCITAFLTAARDANNGQMGEMHYEVEARHDNDDTLFAVRFKRGVPLLTNAMVSAVTKQSHARVIGASVESGGSIVIRLLRESHLGAHRAKQFYEQLISRKKRHIMCDYSAANVTSEDDQTTIDNVVDSVYHMRERLPASMSFWFEKIRGEGCGADTRGSSIPLTQRMANDCVGDESESLADGVNAPVIGYSLCFSNVGRVDGAFIEYLHRKYQSLVVSSFVWIDVPALISDDTVLVVNVRAACAVAADVVPKMPRGTAVKRARRTAVRTK